MRRLTPYLPLALLVLGSGLGIGLGLAQAPTIAHRSAVPSRRSVTTLPSTPVSPSSTTTPSSATSSPPSLQTLAFFSPSSGYALFDDQVNGACQELVGSTTDGGAHFFALTLVDSAPCGLGLPVSSLAFDDHGDGFAYGPDLVETHDGGRTWQQVPTPGSVLSVEALGDSIWMVEQGCPTEQIASPGAAPCPLDLLESDDGGRTWRPPPTNPGAAIATGSLENGSAYQSWLVRVGVSSAYLVGPPAPSLNVTSNASSYWFTGDGGSTWSTGSIPCGIGGWYMTLSAGPGGTLFAACAGQPSAGAQVKSVSVSHDAGRTWIIENPCPGFASSCLNASPMEHGYLGQIDAVSATTAYLYGPRWDLLVTHDAGVTWASTGVIADYPAQMIFFDAEHGVALGTSQTQEGPFIWHTSDGGHTWSSITPTTG